MNTEKSALIKENYELIEKAISRLWASSEIDKSKVDKAQIDKALTILEIVEENNDVIALPDSHILIINLMLRFCVSELPNLHQSPLFISEQEKSSLKELISKLSEI